MTENEALSALHFLLGYEKAVDKGEIEGNSFLNSQEKEALQFILEEIQQYRAMEEKLNGISVEQVVNGFINTVEDRTEEPYERGRILTNTEADMWNEYQAIGTVEEFKAFRSGDFTENLLNMGYTKGYNKAIDEFAKSLKTDYLNFELYYIFQDNEFADDTTSLKYYQKMIDEIAEELKRSSYGE